MYLTEYNRISIDNFMGLFDRGSLDDIPQDHATHILNMAFARKRETLTRPSASYSVDSPGGNTERQFLACFNNSNVEYLIPLVCDGAGNIWRLDNYSVLLHVDGMIDFAALNMGDATYIAPMSEYGLNDPNYNPMTNVIYVWNRPSFPPRPAAGPMAAKPFSITWTGSGNVGPGWYGVSICYVYDTGYVTPPSDRIVEYAPGGTNMTINGIVAPPSGVSGILILSTQAQSTSQTAGVAALYEVGTVGLGETSVTVNFFDTDLVILASNDPVNGNLYNSMGYLPGGSGLGSVALIKYHGRMVIIGPTVSYNQAGQPIRNTDGTLAAAQDGRILVSAAGAQENFDDLTGYFIVDSEFDGNIPRTGFELFGVLYICKLIGTFSTVDTGSQPNDPTTPWVVNIVDGGIGSMHHGVGTITASQPALSFNSTAFLANRNGLFIFNGNVLRPELSWKIRAIWAQIPPGAELQIRVTVDIYNDIFYILLPTLISEFAPYMVLAGDYSLGLDSNNIRWSIYQFPWQVTDLIMGTYPYPSIDHNPPPINNYNYYFLRLGTNTDAIYRLDGAFTYDEVWLHGAYVSAQPINCYYQCAPLVLGVDANGNPAFGSLNICRFIRYRLSGSGTLFTTLNDQSTYPLDFQQAVNTSPQPFPDNYYDQGIQTNFTNEKVIVSFGTDAPYDYVKMARVDVFGKARWPTRPNA